MHTIAKAIANTGMTSSSTIQGSLIGDEQNIVRGVRRLRSSSMASRAGGWFRTFLADADEPLRRAYEVPAGAPRWHGPVAGQQLAGFLEQAAWIFWSGPKMRDFGHATIAPVDQLLPGNPFDRSSGRRALRLSPRNLAQ
jgi:hypothetical protein